MDTLEVTVSLKETACPECGYMYDIVHTWCQEHQRCFMLCADEHRS